MQAPVDKIEDLSDEAWQRTFNINCHSFFWVTKAALPHMPDGSAIINTGSVNGLRGNTKMIDYSATKGAVHAMTMSFAKSLLSRNIRVNCVAPGPVWTPLIPATMPSDSVEGFGGGVRAHLLNAAAYMAWRPDVLAVCSLPCATLCSASRLLIAMTMLTPL